MNKHKNNILSPHIGIYKWQINSLLSIFHRISGGAIYIILLIFFWLFSLNVFFQDNEILNIINQFFEKNIIAKLIISIINFFLYYHIFNGIRHLFWDMGYGFEIKAMHISGLIVLACSFIISVASFLVSYF
jgi:succinate dehydrogenase / fumarate reductase cytochrome b subunit